MIHVGLIGFGYWGPNILRNFLANPNFKVVSLADMDEARQKKALQMDSSLKVTNDAEELIRDEAIDAIAIATPVRTHFNLAYLALKNGKHVLVEKPMCTSSEECQELIKFANKANLTLMVDHTFIMTSAVKKIRELCDSGELGKICSFDSMRINLGLFQQDVNVLWDLAPHDFSIINYLLDEEPMDIEANGYSHLNSDFPDVVYLTMHFPSQVVAHFNLSWMSPVKVRRVSIGGSKKMLVWDDLDPDEKIKVYNSGITYQQQENRNLLIPGYRIGDIFSPRLPNIEALQNVIQHFSEVIKKKTPSLMNGQHGLKVVKMLETSQAALDKTLKRIQHTLQERELCFVDS